jgi:hypothetical protein
MARTRSSKQQSSSGKSAGNENRLNNASNEGDNNKKSRRKSPPESVPTTQSLRQEASQREKHYQDLIAKQARELAALKREREESKELKTPAKRRKSASPTIAVLTLSECSEGEKSSIQNSVNKYIWKHVVFMPESGPLQKGVMQSTYKHMDPRPPKEEVSKEDWVISRVSVVGSAFNSTRSYITCQVKSTIFRYADDVLDGKWPNLDKFRQCALRTIRVQAPEDATDAEKAECEANLAVFVFYWDELLPRAAPNSSKLWDTSTRYVCTITNRDRYKKSPITTQMEAFLVLCLENNWKYWENWYFLSRKLYPKRKIQRCPSKLLPAEDSPQFLRGYFEGEKNTVYFYGPKFDTLYSKLNGGSRMTGGWSEDGITRFEQLCTAIRTARQTPENYDLEIFVYRKVVDNADKRGAKSGAATTLSVKDNKKEAPTNAKLMASIDKDALEWLCGNAEYDSDEEEEEDGKPPARRNDSLDSADQSVGSYEEDEFDDAQVCARESV